ncbi:hypothetical protein PFISCL1PPCAC_16241, partial [Pristionchus fissidentatus]
TNVKYELQNCHEGKTDVHDSLVLCLVPDDVLSTDESKKEISTDGEENDLWISEWDGHPVKIAESLKTRAEVLELNEE